MTPRILPEWEEWKYKLLRIPLQSKTKSGKTAFVDMPNFNKKLYFSYIRMSTGKHTQEHSPERQRDYLKLYTKKIWIDYDKQVIEFKDPWESGFKVKVINGKAVWTRRKEFARMWEYIQACKVPCEVFVYDISRYSRHDQIGVQELSVALWLEWKEHQKIEKFHIAESEEVYTIDTPGSKISGDIRSKMQESEGKRRKSNTNITIWTDKKILPKMVASKLSSKKVFEWVIENGIEWIRKWPNFIHIEHAIDMRIEGRTVQEIHDYLVNNGVDYGIGNLNTTIFTNEVLIGIYCPKKWKNQWEITELQFLDCVTPISLEKWRKLQDTMKHRAPYRTKQVEGSFIRPVIHIMRFVGGDEVGWNFRFYSKSKWWEQYWYIRYRKGHKTLVTISLIELLREFIKQQWGALFDIFYNISRKAFKDSLKDTSIGDLRYISKESFWNKENIEELFKKKLKDIFHSTNFGKRWTLEKLYSLPIVDTMREVIDYNACLKDVFNETKDIEVEKEIEELEFVEHLFFVWDSALFGEDILKAYFLKNISWEDKALIQNSKAHIDHLKWEIDHLSNQIVGINDRIIDGIISKENLPRANEKIDTIKQEITELQKKIANLEHSSDIEKYIGRMPTIIRKIGELTVKPFTEKDFTKNFPEIVKLIEITCGELTLTKEKALKIGLYEVLERFKDIDNLNWQDECLLLANFIEHYDTVKERHGADF